MRFGFNFGRNVNEITLANRDDLSEATVVDQMLAGTLAVEGQPIGSMYAYRFAGINQDNGYPLFYAKNGQKVHRALRQDFGVSALWFYIPETFRGIRHAGDFQESTFLYP